MQQVQCSLMELTPLTSTVSKVLLKPAQTLSFQPGQYLKLCLSDTDKRPFSIANIAGMGYLELHIGSSQRDNYALAAIKHLKSQPTIEIELPFGNAFLRPEDRPIILLAGGTGFSYVQSLLMGLMATERHEPVFLYWGCRQASDLYALPQLRQWQSQFSWLTVVPVVTHADDTWQGRSGQLLDALAHDFISLEPYSLYMAGRFDRVGPARELFLQKGMLPQHMYADAFEFI